jgi:hypothetical protein
VSRGDAAALSLAASLSPTPWRLAMKTIVVLVAAVLVAGCAHRGAPGTSARREAQAAAHEGELAAALAGRTAGPPQDCVEERDLGDNTFYGDRAILFRGPSSEVVYLNRPAARCPASGLDLALKARTTMTRLCRGDVVTVFDPGSRIEYGECVLGEFTPYRTPR